MSDRKIVKAYTCHYGDTGQIVAYVDWSDGSTTSGTDPVDGHMYALFLRARREGLTIERLDA